MRVATLVTLMRFLYFRWRLWSLRRRVAVLLDEAQYFHARAGAACAQGEQLQLEERRLINRVLRRGGARRRLTA